MSLDFRRFWDKNINFPTMKFATSRHFKRHVFIYFNYINFGFTLKMDVLYSIFLDTSTIHVNTKYCILFILVCNYSQSSNIREAFYMQLEFFVSCLDIWNKN